MTLAAATLMLLACNNDTELTTTVDDDAPDTVSFTAYDPFTGISGTAQTAINAWIAGNRTTGEHMNANILFSLIDQRYVTQS